MRIVSRIDQALLEDGNYQLLEEIVYKSARYGKTITVPVGAISDGATGAMDITSRSWWVHDELCRRGTWDDGSKISNWECSQILQDILVEEGRYWQSKRWFWATWIFGGGEARKNGMLRVASILVVCFLSSCAYNSQTITAGDNSKIDCRGSVDKPVDVNTTAPIAVGQTPASNVNNK